MQHRTTRGIQYEDVAQAADALLQDGLRPTIERIRLHIGRGSPNTVSPMLEQWFSGLGERLGGAGGRAKQGADSLPDIVLKAASALWATARDTAQTQAAEACAEQRASLDGEAQQLHEARTQLEARELLLQERLRAMEEALQLSARQLEESNERYKSGLRTLALRDEEIAAQRTAANRLSEQNAALQLRWETAQIQAQQERSAQDDRHRQSERRWLEEVDRARQETRKSALLVQDGVRKLNVLQLEMDSAQTAHQAAEIVQEQQIQTLNQQLVSAQSQAAHERVLLAQWMEKSKSVALLSEGVRSRPRPLHLRTPPARRKLSKNRSD